MDKHEQAKKLLTEWVSKQNHDSCWYYPDIFRQLCDLYGVDYSKMPVQITRREFNGGCSKFQNEVFITNRELK